VTCAYSLSRPFANWLRPARRRPGQARRRACGGRSFHQRIQLLLLRHAGGGATQDATYFLNGGGGGALSREDRIMVPSPKVATYDLKPEMSAPELTTRRVEAIGSAGTT